MGALARLGRGVARLALRVVVGLAVVAALFAALFFWVRSGGGGSATEHVKGYTKKDGTEVRPHERKK